MARMTKDQLIDENARLRAQCDLLETKLASLERDCAELKAQANLAASRAALDAAPRAQARSDKPQPEDYPIYWNYVRACRAWHQARGIRTVSYKSMADWADAVAYAQGANAGY